MELLHTTVEAVEMNFPSLGSLLINYEVFNVSSLKTTGMLIQIQRVESLQLPDSWGEWSVGIHAERPKLLFWQIRIRIFGVPKLLTTWLQVHAKVERLCTTSSCMLAVFTCKLHISSVLWQDRRNQLSLFYAKLNANPNYELFCTQLIYVKIVLIWLKRKLLNLRLSVRVTG